MTKRKTFDRCALFSAVAATIALSTNAHQAVAEADNFFLEEVIVTAQKRSESVQDIAASISAVSGDALEKNGITDFTDATKMVAGLQMKQSSATATVITLRGITYDRHSASSEAVDVYVNEGPYRAASMFTSMFDIERLEVLRGPQGTLQGKTSPAGAILVHTKRPSFGETEGQIRTQINGDGDTLSEFGLSLPVTDTLAVRIAGIYNSNNGKGGQDYFTGAEDTSHMSGGRFSVAYEPNDDFDAFFAHETVELTGVETEQVAGSYNGHVDPDQPSISGQDYGVIGLGDKIGVANRLHETEIDTEISTLKMNWRGIAGLELTSVTSYNEMVLDEINDRDPSGIYPNDYLRANVLNNASGFSQEIRLASTEDNWWEYTLGAFYSRSKTKALSTNGRSPSSVNSIDLLITTAMETETFGYFTHNRIDINDVSELQIGLRYNRTRRDTISNMDVDLNGAPLVTGVDLGSNPDYADDYFTGGIKYIRYLSEDAMFYTSLDASHRPGARTINPRVTNVDHIYALQSDEEDTVAFEVGFKSTLFDGRMHFNGAVYYQDMNEYQAFYKEIEIADDSSDPSDITDTNLVANTDAISIGAELELKGFINESWLAGLLLSHNDFKFADGEEGFCNEGPAFNATHWVNTCEVGGSRVGDSPNWSISVNSEYTVPLDEADVFVRGLYSFSSASYQPALPDADSKAASYGIVDMFAGLRSKDGDWEASLWAKNLMDKVAETERRVVEDNGYREIAVVDERTIGLSLRYNFNL